MAAEADAQARAEADTRPLTGTGSHPELRLMDLSANTYTATTAQQRRRCEVLLADAPFAIDEASGDEKYEARAAVRHYHLAAQITKKHNLTVWQGEREEQEKTQGEAKPPLAVKDRWNPEPDPPPKPKRREWPKEQVTKARALKSERDVHAFVKFVVHRKLGKLSFMFGFVEGIIRMFDRRRSVKPRSCYLRCMRVWGWEHPKEVRAELLRRKRDDVVEWWRSETKTPSVIVNITNNIIKHETSLIHSTFR